MSNKPSLGALDFARRHGLPEPRTRSEAVKQMRGILEPLGSASWRDHWRRALKERGIDVPEYCKRNSSDQ